MWVQLLTDNIQPALIILHNFETRIIVCVVCTVQTLYLLYLKNIKKQYSSQLTYCCCLWLNLHFWFYYRCLCSLLVVFSRFYAKSAKIVEFWKFTCEKWFFPVLIKFFTAETDNSIRYIVHTVNHFSKYCVLYCILWKLNVKVKTLETSKTEETWGWAVGTRWSA